MRRERMQVEGKTKVGLGGYQSACKFTCPAHTSNGLSEDFPVMRQHGRACAPKIHAKKQDLWTTNRKHQNLVSWKIQHPDQYFLIPDTKNIKTSNRIRQATLFHFDHESAFLVHGRYPSTIALRSCYLEFGIADENKISQPSNFHPCIKVVEIVFAVCD